MILLLAPLQKCIFIDYVRVYKREALNEYREPLGSRQQIEPVRKVSPELQKEKEELGLKQMNSHSLRNQDLDYSFSQGNSRQERPRNVISQQKNSDDAYFRSKSRQKNLQLADYTYDDPIQESSIKQKSESLEQQSSGQYLDNPPYDDGFSQPSFMDPEGYSVEQNLGMKSELTESIYPFLEQLTVRETFQPPHNNALSFEVLNDSQGYIGYENEGLKKFEVKEDQTVKILSLKEGKAACNHNSWDIYFDS